MAFHRLAMCVLVGLSVVGCGDDSRPSGDTGPRVDTTVSDAGRDAPVACTGDPDCDDGHECTIDMCGVGNVCRYTPLDERCEDGEMCLIGAGCASGCESNEDCDDGDFCNGPERCIMTPTGGECFDSLDPADCNDGNMCTIDMCSTEVNGCVYETAEGCDAGPVGSDGGMPPEPFDPEVHYEGTFLLAGVPAASLGCPPSSYAVNEITMEVVGGDLRVTSAQTPPRPDFVMTQSPRPDGPTFNVTGTDTYCNSVSLSGTFEDSDTFMVTWMAGPCASMLSPSGCESHTNSLFGQRR